MTCKCCALDTFGQQALILWSSVFFFFFFFFFFFLVFSQKLHGRVTRNIEKKAHGLSLVSQTCSCGKLKKSGCLCSKHLTSLLRHVYVNRLVWVHGIPRTLVSGTLHETSPFWYDCSLRCALRRRHLKKSSKVYCHNFWLALFVLLVSFLAKKKKLKRFVGDSTWKR